MYRLKVLDSGESTLTWFPDQDGGDLERDHSALVDYLNSLGDEGWQIVLGQVSGKDSPGMYEDGAFLLSGVTPVVQQVLDMTGFSNIIRIEPTADEALAAAAG